MIEPLTASLLYALGEVAKGCTIEAVSGGIAGNVGDRLLCKITDETAKQFKSQILHPTNHDLLRGMVSAHSKALKFYAETLNQQATALDRPIADKVKKLSEGSFEFDENSLNALMRSISPLLANPGEQQLDDRRERFIEAAIIALSTAIERQIQEKLPERFRKLLRERAENGRESWQERFRLYLTELIKDERTYGSRFRNIFIASNLSDIIGHVVTVQDLAGSMIRDLSVIQDKIESLKDDTTRILDLLEARKPDPSIDEWPEPSSDLSTLAERARSFSDVREGSDAIEAWREVEKKAADERHVPTQIRARCNLAILAIKYEVDLAKARSIAEKCASLAQDVELGSIRVSLNQTMGEVYRVCGDEERARGFLRSAMREANQLGLPIDEAYSIMALSALEPVAGESERHQRYLDLVELARTKLQDARANPAVDQVRVSEASAFFHMWLAHRKRFVDPHDALAHLNTAITILTDLKDDAEEELASALTQRGDILLFQQEFRAAEDDFDKARELCKKLNFAIGLANIDAAIANNFMLMNRNDEAERYQLTAINHLLNEDNERLTYPFWYNYAKILQVGGKDDLAYEIYKGIFESEWVAPEKRLSCARELLKIAVKKENISAKKRWFDEARLILTREMRAKRSASELRGAELRYADLLRDGGKCADAEAIYFRHLKCLDRADDLDEIAHLWIEIASTKQRDNDNEGAIEFYKKALELGAPNKGDDFHLPTLIVLAHLEIEAGEFESAAHHLIRATRAAPDDPMIRALIVEARSKLPSLSPFGLRAQENNNLSYHPSMDELIGNLQQWLARYPGRSDSILMVWYHQFNNSIWEGFRRAFGEKVLIFADSVSDFNQACDAFAQRSDLKAWATQFGFETGRSATVDDFDFVPVPMDLPMSPDEGLLVIRKPSSNDLATGNLPSRLARQQSIRMQNAEDEIITLSSAYHLTFEEDEDGTRAAYVGAKREWTTDEVVSFMVDKSIMTPAGVEKICLPIGEGEIRPSLSHCLNLARDLSAFPVFVGSPYQGAADRIKSEKKLTMPMRTQGDPVWPQYFWSDLMAAVAVDPNKAMREFSDLVERSAGNAEDFLEARLTIFELVGEETPFLLPALFCESTAFADTPES